MSRLDNRLQVLLDDDRLRRLEERAKATGASVGSLVREAIDVAYPGVRTDRQRAGAALLAAEPIDVGDWDQVKGEISAMWEKHL